MLAVLTAAFSNDRVGSPGVALHIGTSIHNYDNGLNISIPEMPLPNQEKSGNLTNVKMWLIYV